MESDGIGAFGNLPDVMVAELLALAPDVAETLSGRVAGLSERREGMRERALSEGLIRELDQAVPGLDGLTVAAVDGSCAVERLSGVDVYAAAAVRVPGFGGSVEPTPPGHAIEIHAVDALMNGSRLNQALMSFQECELVSSSSADLVLLDGAISSITLSAGLALQNTNEERDSLSHAVGKWWRNHAKDAIQDMMRSCAVVSIPKRSTADNEFATETLVFENREADMTGLATANLILEESEYSLPMSLRPERMNLRGTGLPDDYVEELMPLFADMRVVYFRPRDWSPAYRLELAPSGAENRELLERQLALLREQVVNPAMREPYPLYLADRFVRSLSLGMSAVTEAVRRDVTARSDDVELVSRFLSYGRSEPFMEVESE